MGYIITAEADTEDHMNMLGDMTKVDARVLSQHDGYVTFDVRGDFDSEKQKQLTKKLCETLIDAGFVAFRIGHSY